MAVDDDKTPVFVVYELQFEPKRRRGWVDAIVFWAVVVAVILLVL